MKTLSLFAASLMLLTCNASAQEENQEDGQAPGRVQYALILPDEKTPELVKETEISPFKPTQSQERDEGTTEENLVRELLLRLPAVGGASGSAGMRVMLGGMRLVEGAKVPPVLPDQQVALKVKSITSTAIELQWIEKKPSSLPPKILTIPLDVGPKVRHQLPTPSGGRGAPTGSIGTIRRNGVPVLIAPSEPGFASAHPDMRGVPPTFDSSPAPQDEPQPASDVAAAEVPPPADEDASSTPPADPLPATSDLPQASVLRMLFGNHAPAGK